MQGRARRKPALVWVARIAVLALGLLWLIPTLGLVVSSFRTGDQIAASGWWRALAPTEQIKVLRTAGAMAQREEAGTFVIEGDLFTPAMREAGASLTGWGFSSRASRLMAPGQTGQLRGGGTMTVDAAGHYRLEKATPFQGENGRYIFVRLRTPPIFTLDNYRALFATQSSPGTAGAQETGMARVFLNTLSVTVPATILPVIAAAFAAYALAWMRFRARASLIVIMVGMLALPLQMALIPLLELHANIGIGKGYLALWLAHTALALPFAIYLMRAWMAGLPRGAIETARVDGANDYQIFIRIVAPLSLPAIASFGVLQFLWTWNDLLAARVFLIDASGSPAVLTNRLVELLGARNAEWQVLAPAAIVSFALPVLLFLALHKALVRGLLALSGAQR